jgi:hypothetical protein
MSRKWEFADGLYVKEPEEQTGIQHADFGEMRTKWVASQASGKASKKKGGKVSKEDIDAMLERLKSNKLLHSSNPEDSNGTLESLSAFAISILGHVCDQSP